jgi:hypothetical protein
MEGLFITQLDKLQQELQVSNAENILLKRQEQTQQDKLHSGEGTFVAY